MDQKSESCRFSRNYLSCSQSRKISVGILADAAASNVEKNDVNLVNGTTDKCKHAKDSKANSSLGGKNKTVAQKEAFAQYSLGCLNTNNGGHDNKHSVAGMSGLESIASRLRKSGNTACEISNNDKNGVHVQNMECSVEPTLMEKEITGDKSKQIRNSGGNETLRMKLWEVLGNVSSPKKQHPSFELNVAQERVGNLSPIPMMDLNSDSIESDSEKQTLRRPVTRSLRKKKAPAEVERHKSAATKSSCLRKGPAQSSVFSLNGGRYGRLNCKINVNSPTSKRSKVATEVSGMDVHESPTYKILQDKHQSDTKSRSSPAVEEFDMNIDEVPIAKISEDRVKVSLPASVTGIQKHNPFGSSLKVGSAKDLTPDPVIHIERQNSFGSPINVIHEFQKENQQQQDVERFKGQKVHLEDRGNSLFQKAIDRINNASVGAKTSNQKNILHEDDKLGNIKNQQKGMPNCSSKSRRGYHTDDPSSPDFGVELPGVLRHSRQGSLMKSTPNDKMFNPTSIRSFKSLSRSKFSGRKRKEMDSSSDGTDEINHRLQMEPRFVMEVDGKTQTPRSATDASDSESSGDESPMTGCRESIQLSPKVCGNEKFQHDSHRNSDSEKDDKGSGSSPVTYMSTGSHESASQMHLDQNSNDGLDGVVELLIMALDRIKTKLNSLTSQRSASILQASAAAIHSLLQNAESQVNEDASKLTSLSHSRRKLLETKFQEKQEHLLGICRRFKKEIDMQLQDYGDLVDDLEGNKFELKRSIERQRAAHKKIMSELAQGIRGHVQDAETKITAVQKLAAEKMLQLKLVVAESIKHVAPC